VNVVVVRKKGLTWYSWCQKWDLHEYRPEMDQALHIIMDQFKEVKSNISDVIEDKVGNCTSAIAEGLKTNLNSLRNEVKALELRMNEGKVEMEGKLEGQQKEVTAIVEQQTRHIRKDIESAGRELEARLAAVDARAGRAGAAVQGSAPLQ
jgi:uncharacterized membrane protein YkoI